MACETEGCLTMHSRMLAVQAWDPDSSNTAFPSVSYLIPALSEIPPLEELVGDCVVEVSVLLPAASPQRDGVLTPESCMVTSTTHVVQELALDMDFPIVWGPFSTQQSANAFAELRTVERLREAADYPVDDIDRILTALDQGELVRSTQLEM